MTYKMYVSTAHFVYDKKTEALEWPDDDKFEQKAVGEFDTVEAALNEASEWGSRWVMYPSLIIEDEEGSEVYSSYPALYKCECCGNEKWERIESDMRLMRKADGSRLFPEVN